MTLFDLSSYVLQSLALCVTVRIRATAATRDNDSEIDEFLSSENDSSLIISTVISLLLSLLTTDSCLLQI